MSIPPLMKAFVIVLMGLGAGLDAQSSALSLLRQRAMEVQSQTFSDATCQRAPQCVQPQIDELKKLIRDYTLAKLNESHGDTDALIRDLAAVDDAWFDQELVRQLGGKRKQTRDRPPFAYRRKTPGGDIIVVINSFAMWALALPKDAVLIQGFREENGEYKFVGETGDSLFGIFDEYHPAQILQSPVENEIWFILGGQVSWFMGHLDRVRVYSFNGHQFRELWAPEDRQDMEIAIQNDRIVTQYMVKNNGSFGVPVMHNMREHLVLSRTGVSRRLLEDLGGETPRKLELPGKEK